MNAMKRSRLALISLSVFGLALQSCAPAPLYRAGSGQYSIESTPSSAGLCTNMIVRVEDASGMEVKVMLASSKRTDLITTGEGQHTLRASCPDSSTPTSKVLETGARNVYVQGKGDGTITVTQR